MKTLTLTNAGHRITVSGHFWTLEKKRLRKIAEKSGGKQILLSAFNWGDFARYEIEPKVSHFSSIPLDQTKPLNNEEKKNAFIKELCPGTLKKQRAFKNFESAVEEKDASFRIETGSGADYHIRFSILKRRMREPKKAKTYSYLC